MGGPEYNLHDDHQYDPIDHWTCPQCFKTISASRPPVFNPNNCCCVEASGIINDHAHISRPNVPIFEKKVHQHDLATPTPTYHVRPQFSASSTTSVSCLEGSEIKVPNTPTMHTYLSLSPEIGLNEIAHQRSSSFHEELSYPMRRFLELEQSQHYYYPDDSSQESLPLPRPKFLKQDICIRSSTSVRVNKGSKGSKVSYRSVQSSGSGRGNGSWMSLGVDPTTGMGGWVDEGENGVPWYPRGIGECAVEDD